jgi:hypothetical protein
MIMETLEFVVEASSEELVATVKAVSLENGENWQRVIVDPSEDFEAMVKEEMAKNGFSGWFYWGAQRFFV